MCNWSTTLPGKRLPQPLRGVWKPLLKELAAKVGQEIAKKAQEAGITSVVFDRNGYLYHGRVKELADAARNGGLKF